MDPKYLPYFFNGSKLASVLIIAGLIYKFIESYRIVGDLLPEKR
jgi:hypothetical protein